jgi:hypothetical protein
MRLFFTLAAFLEDINEIAKLATVNEKILRLRTII